MRGLTFVRLGKNNLDELIYDDEKNDYFIAVSVFMMEILFSFIESFFLIVFRIQHSILIIETNQFKNILILLY